MVKLLASLLVGLKDVLMDELMADMKDQRTVVMLAEMTADSMAGK